MIFLYLSCILDTMSGHMAILVALTCGQKPDDGIPSIYFFSEAGGFEDRQMRPFGDKKERNMFNESNQPRVTG
jgi:hypothetical protein